MYITAIGGSKHSLKMDLSKWLKVMFLFTLSFQIHCFLKINYFPIEGGTAEIECTSHEISTNRHISWINPQNKIVSNCTFPGYCTIPTDPRFQVTGSNGTSKLQIHRTIYTMDDGIWNCVFNAYQSSGRLYIISKPTHFSFLNPPPYGTLISNNWILLNGKADCTYPEPKYINLKYRIKGDREFNNFQSRRPNHQNITNTSICREHETSINITIPVYKDDFHDVIVFFQFSYTTLSGHTFSTTDVADIAFPGTSKVCPLNPCQHNGSCLESGECNCLPNFTGMFCEEAISNGSTIYSTSPVTAIPTVSTTDRQDERASYEFAGIIIGAIIVPCVLIFVISCIVYRIKNDKNRENDNNSMAYFIFGNEGSDHNFPEETPQSSAGVLQSSADISQSSAGVPQSSVGVPQSLGDVPKSSGDVPKSSADVSHSSADVSQSSVGVPQSSVGVPQSSADVPQSSGDVPKSSADVPHSSADVSQSSVGVPQSSVGVPQSSADVPQSSVGFPQSSADIPHSSVGVPQSSGDGFQSSADVQETYV